MSVETDQNFRHKKLIAVGLLLLTLSLIYLIVFIKPPFSGARYAGYVLDPAIAAPAFSLTDLNNQTVTLESFQGTYVYLMFGYLNCTEVCHSQVLLLDRLSKEVKEGDVNYVYISMDPERDGINQLRHYFQTKSARQFVLRGHNKKKLQALANQFNAPFSFNPVGESAGEAGSNYDISHPGYVFLINPRGYISLIYTGKLIDTNMIYKDLIEYKLNHGGG